MAIKFGKMVNNVDTRMFDCREIFNNNLLIGYYIKRKERFSSRFKFFFVKQGASPANSRIGFPTATELKLFLEKELNG